MLFVAFSICARHAGSATSWGRARVEGGMELIFVCPATGRKVDSGIETGLETLVHIMDENVRARCPACGQWHEWRVRDALPAKAA